LLASTTSDADARSAAAGRQSSNPMISVFLITAG
jgi:hypothetical protein